MFEYMSDDVKRILVYIEEKSKSCNISPIGTEYILEGMYMNKDSICKFLFSEYLIELEDLVEVTNQFHIIRKETNTKYNSKVTKVFEKALENARVMRSSLVEEEHLFLAILEINDTLAIKVIELLGMKPVELLEDLKQMYNFVGDVKFTKSLSKKIKEDFQPIIGREEYIFRINNILNRKTKNNPLLIGNAGVGKTAIVEGLAQHYIKNKIQTEIVVFDIAEALAGTKYRGDFEERLINVINNVEGHDVVLFIDEIHNLVGAGSSEGALDAANILKPILARGTIRCIGATTLEEYRKYIEKDKALSRRFQNIFVDEPNSEETLKILFGIKKHYQEFHNVLISNQVLRYIVLSSSKIKRQFPDKAIDLLDETLSYVKVNRRKRAYISDVNNVVRYMEGYYEPSVLKGSFRKYQIQQEMAIGNQKVLFSCGCRNEAKRQVKEKIMYEFSIKDEMCLEIDFSLYADSQAVSSLIGTNPGYVGYEDGGILTNHVSKFPRSLIVINKFFFANRLLIDMIKRIIKQGYIINRKGEKAFFTNTVFLFVLDVENKNLGFVFNEKKNNLNFIDEIIDMETKALFDVSKLVDWKVRGYDITLNFDLEIFSKEELEEFFINFFLDNPKGKYTITESMIKL